MSLSDGTQAVGVSVHTHEWTLVALGTLNFRNFLAFKNHLRNKPHLHVKGANKLKMRFIS